MYKRKFLIKIKTIAKLCGIIDIVRTLTILRQKQLKS